MKLIILTPDEKADMSVHVMKATLVSLENSLGLQRTLSGDEKKILELSSCVAATAISIAMQYLEEKQIPSQRS